MMKSSHTKLFVLAWLAVSGCTGGERGESARPTVAPQTAAGGEGQHEGVAREQTSTGQPPAAAGGGDDMAYGLGRQLGEQTTRSAWQNLSRNGGCENVDKLAEVIGRSASRILTNAESYDKPAMLDYAEGYVAGLRGALAEVASSCSDRCSVLCDTAKAASKTVLCEVAKRIGGEVVLRHTAQAPAISCSVGCELPTAIKPGDCS
jgi:hypothetical protein